MEKIQTGPMIARAAAEFKLNPALIAAVIQQESGGDPWAIRFEPGFFKKYLANKQRKDLLGFVSDKASFHTEVYSRAMSFGLMQLLGETARETGFTGEFLTELCAPETNIMWGSKLLRKYLNRHHEDVTDALLAYNGGANLDYPGEVLSRIEKGEVAHLLF